MSNLRPVSDPRLAQGAVDFFQQFAAHDGDTAWPQWLTPYAILKARMEAGKARTIAERNARMENKFGIVSERQTSCSTENED